MASRIEDYGLIGNMRTAAIVSRSGSIDWLCAPRFDSDAFFAALVGYDEHGAWAIRPLAAVRETRQRYRGDTLILETEFVGDGGAARVIDFMPVNGDRCDVVRIVEGLEGELSLEMTLEVRFGYGADSPWIMRDDGGVHFTVGGEAVVMRTQAPFGFRDKRCSSVLTIKKGERLPFQLTWYPSERPAPPPLDAERALAETEAFWREWSGRCRYQGASRDAVMRSLITLKACTYAPTGAIVAAPTTSLPEALGGVRNWDYRFCWLRDASLTLDALLIGGYVDEARGFRDWLLRVMAGDPAGAQIMYGISGERRLTEFDIPWLPGYEGSHPVRVGNAASEQFQLDVFGEMFSCLYAGRKRGLAAHSEGWGPGRAMIEHVERVWQQPDDGIWEVRGGRRHFTHSKVMAWVAIDRAARGIEEMGFGDEEGRAMLPHLQALRTRIHAEVCERGFNPRVGAFTQSYGSDAMDASILIMPHVGFLPASDPRVQGTVAAVERTLLRDGFVLRYDTQHGADGLPGTEGAFLACSFWLADNYALAGRVADAEELFGRLLGLRNHLGLLAEEYDPVLQRQIGNFPQAFSHLALVFTARLIDLARQGDAQSLVQGESTPSLH
jgi:GH15 family glucan-1,4-alpha-glucosidase